MSPASLYPGDRGLLAAVGLGAAIRVAYWITKWDRALGFNDSAYYSDQARGLFHGKVFRDAFVDHAGAEHGPLTSLLMAPVSWGPDFVRWQRLVTVVCGVITVWLVGLLAGRLAGRRVGLVAAFVAALYPNLWMNDGLVMSESVSVLAVVTALWFAWSAAHAEPGERAPGVWAGVSLGCAVLARSELVIFAALLIVFVALVRTRRGLRGSDVWATTGWVAGAALLVVLPWVTFNLLRFERPVLLTTNDGATLLGANCDDMYHGGNAGGWTVFCAVGDPFEEPSIRAAHQRSEAITYARQHAGELPTVVVARVARAFDLYGLEDLLHQDVGEERPRWAAWAGILTFWFLAPFTVFGATRLPRRARWLMLTPVLAVLCTAVLFYGGHRIRSSAEPSVVVLGAVGLTTVASRDRSRDAR